MIETFIIKEFRPGSEKNIRKTIDAKGFENKNRNFSFKVQPSLMQNI